MKNSFTKITAKIEKGEDLSPFLFLGENTEMLDAKVSQLATSLLEEYNVPQVNLLRLNDDGENIKIKDIKEFVKPWELWSPYKFQIFLIENISRMTIQSFNSCLKFFEEPWVQNIIFLTNKSESGVLDTILSRVQVIHLWLHKSLEEDAFYFFLLDGYLNKKSSEIFSYFFRNKLEKEDYVSFLKNMIFYAKKHGVFLDLLTDLDSDMNLIQWNNVNAKYVVDKYLLKI